MRLKNIFLEIVKQKYDEIRAKQQNGIFEKILHFEGNAIGQVGEKFTKEVFNGLDLPLNCFKE